MFRYSVFVLLLAMVLAGCSSKPDWDDYKDGTHFMIAVDRTDGGNPNVLPDTIEVLKKRLHDYGAREYLIEVMNRDTFAIQFPRELALDKPLRDLILRPYKLTFRLVNEKVSPADLLSGDFPQDSERLYAENEDARTKSATKIPYAVEKKVLLTGETISDAIVRFDKHTNDPTVVFELNAQGARRFEEITGRNIKRRLAIVLDRQVLSAPVIQAKIAGGRAVLTGNFTVKDAKMLAIALKQGPYPAPLKLLSESAVTKASWLGNTARSGK